MMNMLSASQGKFYAAASSGHNVVLTGQAGSGKSFVLRKFSEDAKKTGKVVSITCSTGIAATQFKNGLTLHRWCGIGDGGIQLNELTKLVCNDERYKQTRQRIESCDILIVDECSMISKRIFEIVEALCRSVRKNERYFGGIQVIFSGDFYQLPPVSDDLFGDSGKYCFESSYFFLALPHHINLETVFRQKDAKLISCINSLGKGLLSTDITDYIKTLERNINETEKTMYLFARNYKTDLFNHDKLQRMPGTLKVYESSDEGDSFYLRKFQAPPKLGIKIGCPVMLTVNLSDSLVNGSVGKVQDFQMDEIVVHFPSINQTVTIRRHLFNKIDPVSRKTLSKRLQFPLILAFGITIHKSQGMTIDSVVVDCEDANIPGQIGVALSRAVNSENLQVKNFRPHLIKSHSRQVSEFYNSESKPCLGDCSCCKNEFISSEVLSNLIVPFEMEILPSSESDDEDDGFEEGDDSINSEYYQSLMIDVEAKNNSNCTSDHDKPGISDLKEIEHSCSPLPDYINPNDIINSIYEDFVDTPLQTSIDKLKSKIENNLSVFFPWLSGLFLSLQKILDANIPESGTTQTKNLTCYGSELNAFLISDTYINSCKNVLSNLDIDTPELDLTFFTSAAYKIQNIIVRKKSDSITTSDIRERVVPSETFEEGKGSVRYIGGYCISKIKFKYQKQVQNSLFDASKESKLKSSREKVNILSTLITSYSDLCCTSSYPETLKTTSRKQNMREGLTNITDSAYIFFQSLNTKLRGKETFKYLYTHAEKTVQVIKQEILADTELNNSWKTIFCQNDCSFDSECLLELFNEVVSRFVNVSASRFRKDFLDSLKVEKGKAHRKKVMEKKKSSDGKISIDEIACDRSEGKVVSHLKLKAFAIMDSNYFNDQKYTKKDLQLFCEAYNILTSYKYTKKYINDQLIKEIPKHEALLNPLVFSKRDLVTETESTSEDPSPSGSCTIDVEPATVSSSKGKGKHKRTSRLSNKGTVKKRKTANEYVEEKSEGHCPVCSGIYDNSPNWIQCDRCDEWFHGHCVGITSSEHWTFYEDENKQFLCPFCC